MSRSCSKYAGLTGLRALKPLNVILIFLVIHTEFPVTNIRNNIIIKCADFISLHIPDKIT